MNLIQVVILIALPIFVSYLIVKVLDTKHRQDEAAKSAEGSAAVYNADRTASETMDTDHPLPKGTAKPAGSTQPLNLASHFRQSAGLVRSIFSFEWTWRAFLCLQILGISVLVFLDVTRGENWSALPSFTDYDGRADFEWDFLKNYQWTRYRANWVMLACLVGPFLLAKGMDWICSAPRNISKPQPGPK